jgi:hypothetical protein
MIRLFTLALLLPFVIVTTASGNYNYHAASGYYTYSGYPNQYYSRTYYAPGTYYQGTCYNYGYYVYTPVAYTPPITNNITVNVPVKTKDWKSDLITMLQAREEDAAYHTALRLAGYNGQGQMTYGGGQYGYGQLAYGSITSTTGFGYSAAAINDLYNQTDVNRLMQSWAQLASNQQEISGEVTKQFGVAADAEATRNAALLETRLKTQAVIAFLQNLKEPRTTTITTATQTGAAITSPPAVVNGGGTTTVMTMPLDQLDKTWIASANNRCASCHAGDKKEGNFRLEDIARLDAAGKMRVLSRVHPGADPTKRMPKNGPPLPAEEYQLWARKMLGI